MRPKRTIRVVLWTAEEPGLLGAQYYYETHKTWTNETFVFVSESDEGTFKPTSLNATMSFRGSDEALKKIGDISLQLQALGIPISVHRGSDLGDADFWAEDGVPGFIYLNYDMINHYFIF